MLVLARATVASSFQDAKSPLAAGMNTVAPENVKFVRDHQAEIQRYNQAMEALDR
jgi:hypothetical protein